MERKNGLIQRKRLTELAEQMQDCRIIYAQAPAGYGKTVFAGQWLTSRPQPCAGITLDEFDDTEFDLCCKLKTLLEALYPHSPHVLAFTNHPEFHSAPREFLMRAAAAAPPEAPASIVIDDFHSISHPSPERLLLLFLLRLPRDTKILMLSRNAPPDSFSGLILKGELQIIPREELRFTSGEISALYRSRRRTITTGQAEDIFRLTEGWPIGISALLLSDAEPGKRELQPPQLEGFLKTQVWDSWSRESKNLLVASSMEEELTEELCRCLTGLANSEEILDELCSKGAFLVKQADGTYRFHRLFREFLQKQLQECPEETRSNQYRLAGGYYLEKKDFYRAIQRFSQAGDSHQIAHCFDLLEHIARSGADTERVMQAVEEHVDEKVARDHPFLYFMLAFTARNRGKVEEFEKYADAYYENQPRVARQNPERTHNIFFLYAMDFRYTLREIAEKGKELLGDGPPRILCGSAASYFPLYHRSFRDFSELALGDIDRGAEETDRALGIFLGPERTMLIECIRAGLCYEKGLLAQARELALAAVSRIQGGFMVKSNFCALILLLVIEYALNQREEALVLEQEIQTMLQRDGLFFLQPGFEAVLAKQRLSSGNPHEARAWLAAHDRELSSRVEFLELYPAFTTARAYIASGSLDRATILLQKILELSTAMGRPLDQLEAEILLAICCWKKKRGHQGAALEHLERAIELAQPYGFEQAFANEGAELESMLCRLKSRTARGDYDGPLSGPFVKRLYFQAVQQAAHSKGLTGGRMESGLRFTPRQKKVMDLLCRGYSYRRIGEALGIQFSTVRSHIELIYKKLDVSGAKEAILKIQELHVLDDE